MRKFLTVAVAAIVMLGLAQPAGAITKGGELDEGDHPYVGLMVAKNADGDPLWRCSGTLISPLIYVTAGHCTAADTPDDTSDDPVTATIWFESTLEPTPADFGYPFEGPTSVDGTVYTHPLFVDGAFFLYDLGVVVLDEPVVLDEYATLPDAGYVDTLRKGRSGDQLTAVGYGLQQAKTNPKLADKESALKTRYQADLMIVNTKGVAGIGKIPGSASMLLSGDAKHGGTCFGDSGGPILDGDTLVAVTSFGLNGECAGVGGVFRIDRDLELGWINSFS
ncbi:MAG: trypsin-like serine protease [Ornithinibacter sp.]